MSASEELKPAYKDGIEPALIATNYIPILITDEEHNEPIDDRIISEIRKCGLFVADFTGNRPNVYFEAGFAMGLGIPIIWCAKKDHKELLPFDTRQYNHIFWKDPSDLKEKLTFRIEATVPRSRIGSDLIHPE